MEEPALQEDTERILHLGMQGGGEFVGEIAARRLADKSFGSGQQGSVT